MIPNVPVYFDPPQYVMSACRKFLVSEFEENIENKNFSLRLQPITMESSLTEKGFYVWTKCAAWLLYLEKQIYSNSIWGIYIALALTNPS